MSLFRNRRRIALLFATAFALLLVFAWVRARSPRAPSAESDLDLPALFSPPRDPAVVRAREPERGIPVLCYHYFRPGLNAERVLRVIGALLFNMPTLPDRDFWSVTAPEFDRQMRYLRDGGFRAATLDELAAYREGRLELPERTVVITVDDGDESFYRIAAPILRRYGQRASIFMLTGHAGEKDWNDVDFMTWDQLRDLEQSGVAHVESHTHRMHTKMRRGAVAVPRFLIECRDANGVVSIDSPLGRDLLASRDAIRRELGHETLHLSWPFGFGDAGTDSLATELGFRRLYTLRHAKTLPFADSTFVSLRSGIGRYSITARTPLSVFRRLVEPPSS